jgi:hypothetical protein
MMKAELLMVIKLLPRVEDILSHLALTGRWHEGWGFSALLLCNVNRETAAQMGLLAQRR